HMADGGVLGLHIPCLNRDRGDAGKDVSPADRTEVFFDIPIADCRPPGAAGGQLHARGRGGTRQKPDPARSADAEFIVGGRAKISPSGVRPNESAVVGGFGLASASKRIGSRRRVQVAPRNSSVESAAPVQGTTDDR